MSDAGHLDFGTAKHRAFLDKLIEDDGVRYRYEKDPIAELQKHGIGHDPENPPVPGELPSKDEMRAARDEVVSVMNRAGGHPAMIVQGHPFTNEMAPGHPFHGATPLGHPFHGPLPPGHPFHG